LPTPFRRVFGAEVLFEFLNKGDGKLADIRRMPSSGM
jgi:hypothetical protein